MKSQPSKQSSQSSEVDRVCLAECRRQGAIVGGVLGLLLAVGTLVAVKAMDKPDRYSISALSAVGMALIGRDVLGGYFYERRKSE
ncbi:hypothetical protein ACQ4M3_27865 [Leptolyngbya sp. AN03gr2]|uniref:hypothetical protein n=1 Tax=unclassified Leptolyngbya TaxID=2650499 RepID=UPI003D31DDC8